MLILIVLVAEEYPVLEAKLSTYLAAEENSIGVVKSDEIPLDNLGRAMQTACDAWVAIQYSFNQIVAIILS